MDYNNFNALNKYLSTINDNLTIYEYLYIIKTNNYLYKALFTTCIKHYNDYQLLVKQKNKNEIKQLISKNDEVIKKLFILESNNKLLHNKLEDALLELNKFTNNEIFYDAIE